MTSEQYPVSGALSLRSLSESPSWNLSNISSLLEVLQCDDEDVIVDTLRELQKVASESGSNDRFDDWCRFLSPLCCVPHSSGLVAELMKLVSILYSKSPSFVRSSHSSEIASFVIREFGDWFSCAALESCCSCMESLFFEPEIVDSLFLQHKDFIISTFKKIGKSSPPPAILSTLARISLFPHLGIASNSLETLYNVVERDPPALTLLPSPIFPSSSPLQQYSGLSFLTALKMKLRIVFSEFQTNLPTDPSHLPKYIQLTKDDRFFVTRSIYFCSCSCELPLLLLTATPRIIVDSEIIRELILFVKEALPTILTNISTIDTLIASLPSDSSLTTPSVSGVDTQMIDALKVLRNHCHMFLNDGWCFLTDVTYKIADPHKSSFQTIILDDPSFPNLILNSLKLAHPDIRRRIIHTIINIVVRYPWMKEQFMTANLVGRMFETVDFVSLPLSESETLFGLTKFIEYMMYPNANDEKAQFEQYPLIRGCVFDPAKQFIAFLVRNSDKFVLNENDKIGLKNHLCVIHNHIKNMELRSDEHDTDVVSELVKWEIQTMVEMENENHSTTIFQSMLNRTWEWNRDKRERQKRREMCLREEGWDDAFELRVVGIGVDTHQTIQNRAKHFRIELAFNVDRLE
ncbi:hypothetical protein BLNAU_22429 [Blattamonas nauphoetae]|uniref:FPL domain-containing protein n=1 Tax=Blattamonas nauphoetae TaxID=2049346 RepID=A0ABQ9WT29_9EUKA|nr:hypothetical protein BLNAU_22429 [Blattamonas nauphoetae]